MPERRSSCPEAVQQLWDAISCVRQQKQIPSIDRISSYMKRKHSVEADIVKNEIKHAMKDELLILVRKVGSKGKKQGIEQESYRLPDPKMLKFDSHDWYCFECHRSGDVLLCSSCFRVFHKYCLSEDESIESNLICKVCKMMKCKNPLKTKKDELNVLLGYAALRLKEKACDLHTIPKPEEEPWRHSLLLFQSIDFNGVEKKLENEEYKRVEEFQADIQNIVHNVVIFYGVHSNMADMARQMLRDCICDLGELKQCKDCYRMANEKRDKFWFCEPCNPPHDLVYAKEKGFPYWPAKVLNFSNGVYDIRFFGGAHDRTKCDKEFVKPISTNVTSLVTKRTLAWNKACEELRKHQQLLANGKTTRHDSSEENESEGGSSSSGSSSGTDDGSDDGSGADSDVSRDESSITSSSKSQEKKQTLSNSEDYNVVSSSSQEATSTTRVNCSTQTPKRFMSSGGKSPNKSIQTDKDINSMENVPVNKVLSDFRQKIDTDHKDVKDKAVKELSARLQKEFEIEKQDAIREALHKVQSQLERVKTETEERLREEHRQELEKLTTKHKETISETKKKQWCYNCEVEAIYHCCWNTSYCSIDCQQVHWQREHKRYCRRKR